MSTNIAERILQSSQAMSDKLERLKFAAPITHVYNPLVYARKPHAAYVRRHGNSTKRVLFLGMNPGPWGMAQNGVPFGEIPAIRDWVGICESVDRPKNEHPKRPVQGFDCVKSEVSGRRLWGLFAERFGTADAFFAGHFVMNYCPLVFMEESSRNFTPDKLPVAEQNAIQAACDACLAECIQAFEPEFLIGVGGYAETALLRGKELSGSQAKVGRILHPSPASPAANRDWAGTATRQLTALGVW